MKFVQNILVNFPCQDRITQIFIDSNEDAEKMGFPEGGHWIRVDDGWQLDRSLYQEPAFDETKCHECQGWGAPTGCRTCGTTCMGG